MLFGFTTTNETETGLWNVKRVKFKTFVYFIQFIKNSVIHQ